MTLYFTKIKSINPTATISMVIVVTAMTQLGMTDDESGNGSSLCYMSHMK